MHDKIRNSGRRHFFRALAGTAAIGGLAASGWAQAMATRPEFQGVHEVQGQVFINDRPARPGLTVNPGDTVRTGRNGYVTFVVGEDAFLLRENSVLVVSGTPSLLTRFTLRSGRLLSAFKPRKAPRSLETASVVIGVRGTALYLEAEPDKTYVCICYGQGELQSRADRKTREEITANHHDHPRYIHTSPLNGQSPIVKAPMIGHMDSELAALEWLTGRQPPFKPTVM